MSIWLTEIEAKDPATGDICMWAGPRIGGISPSDAQSRCNEMGQGYCRVIGELLVEVPTKGDGQTPDFDNAVDFGTASLN